MAKGFNWIRPGTMDELVNVKLEWNVQVPFLQTTDGLGVKLLSPLFSPQETPRNSKQHMETASGRQNNTNIHRRVPSQ